MTLPLGDKVVELDNHLETGLVPHAFGGALALAYCTGNPRGTIDIDMNLFVPTNEVERAFDALPPGVRRTRADAAAIARDGQARLWWDDIPIDLFFSYHPLHHQAQERIHTVPFGNVEIPVLSCTDLAVFKGLFARPKDFLDISEMAIARSIDEVELLDWIEQLVGRDDERYRLLKASLAAEPPGPEPVMKLDLEARARDRGEAPSDQ